LPPPYLKRNLNKIQYLILNFNLKKTHSNIAVQIYLIQIYTSKKNENAN